MVSLYRRFGYLLFVLLLISNLTGQTGEIKGRVVKENSEDGIPGVNILLKNTFIGTATDAEGFFRIDNISPGRYILVAQMIGYEKVEVSVTVSADSSRRIHIEMREKVLQSPEITVTAARRAMSKLESPVSITAVSGDKLMLRNPYTLETLMSYQPGIQMVREQINIRGSSGYSRGAGSRVIILVDGVPAISFDNGLIYWDALPVYTIERLEIVKGAGSALYGSNAIGGVVNIITRRINAPKPRSFLRIQSGFYTPPELKRERWTDSPMYSLSWRAAHERTIGKTGIRLGAGRNISTGYYENAWYRRSILDGKIERSLRKNKQFSARFYFIDDVHGAYTQWKDAAHRFHTTEASGDDRTFTNKLHLSTVYRRVISPELSSTIRSQFYLTHFKNDMHNNDTRSTSRTAMAEWQLDYQSGEAFYLIGGIQSQLNGVTSTIWGSHDGLDAALFLQLEYRPTVRLSATAGARWDAHSIDSGTFQTQLNPKLGLNYRLTDRFALRCSLGRAYRAPSIAELFVDTQQGIFEVKPNPSLHSETSYSSEIGVFYETPAFEADLAFFNSQYFRLIEPVQDQTDRKIHFLNITRAQIKGVETSLIWQWKRLPVRNRWSYTYFNPRDLSAHRPLSYRHEHSVILEQEYRIKNWFQTGWTYRYLSRIKRVELFEENHATGADQRVPIHLVDCYLRMNFTAFFQITMSVNNLFQYYYTTVERNMGPLREINLSIQYIL